MAMPEYEDMEEPLLCYIFFNGGKGYSVRPADTYDPLADFFGLSRDERIRPRPDGYSGSQWQNRVQWTRQRLINHGDLDGSIRGVWRLSPQGVQRATRVSSRYSALRR